MRLPRCGGLPSAIRHPPSAMVSCCLLRRALDRSHDAVVVPAAADVGLHVILDFVPARARILLQQRGGAHDLPRLAVAALRHLLGKPCFLQRMAGIRRQALDGGDAAAGKILDRVEARVVGLAVDVHGTRAALADAAAELGAGELEMLAQYPQERGIGERGYGKTL